MIQDILSIDSSIEFHFMPPKSNMINHKNIYKYKKNEPPVYEFLKNGNCFFYSLPPNYSEGGPKVCCESMAAGIPVICDNHSGMKDRVNNETGWKCDNYNQYLEVIKEILKNPEIIKIKGEAARERARKEFIKERWFEEILS
jgi:glycosyltransferase involved in cell wall biosynthesis